MLLYFTLEYDKWGRRMKIRKVLTRDFIMVVIGQIISLFGNQILRFALPLYLLNQTGSAALYGMVSACSFIPMIILCPIGGIIADRVNKRNIMVILDFTTALIVLVTTLLLGHFNIVALLLCTLILLYGIQGAYHPAVQASIPFLMDKDHLMAGNAVITLVSSGANLLGPVLGGALYAFLGIKPILYVGFGCFIASAVMEIFINIPFEKTEHTGGIFSTGIADLKESFHYIRFTQPAIFKVSLVVAGVNMFLTAAAVIGLPIVITQRLGFQQSVGNRLLGYAQGVVAAGSIIGGVLAGTIGRKIPVSRNPIILGLCGILVTPVAFVLLFALPSRTAYIVILFSCFFVMLFAAMFSVQMMSYLQLMAPANLIGKIIACAMCIGMCASPLGQGLFGVLFDRFVDNCYILFFASALITILIALASINTFRHMEKAVSFTD